MKMRSRTFGWATLAALAFHLTDTGQADTVTDWNETTLATQAAVPGGVRTPPASRALAMVHIAIFDSVNAIDRKYTPYLTTRSSLRFRAVAETSPRCQSRNHATVHELREFPRPVTRFRAKKYNQFVGTFCQPNPPCEVNDKLDSPHLIDLHDPTNPILTMNQGFSPLLKEPPGPLRV